MKALILAAGLGTRLGKLTKITPKPLVEVNGKPVIDYVIDGLKRHGYNEIIINVHYKHEQIMDHLGDRVLYSYEPRLLNTAGTVKNLSKWFDYELLVVNADTISNANYTELLKMFYKTRARAVSLSKGNKCAGAYMLNKRAIDAFEAGRTIDECLGSNIIHFNQPDLVYHDCGTLFGLAKAGRYYAKH